MAFMVPPATVRTRPWLFCIPAINANWAGQDKPGQRGTAAVTALQHDVRSEPQIDAESHPVGILAGDIAAPDQVEVDVFLRREAQAELAARLAHAVVRRRGVGLGRLQAAALAVDFADQRERLDEIPFEAGAPGRVADLGDAVIHLSLIHISEPTRRTPISYAVFCLK